MAEKPLSGPQKAQALAWFSGWVVGILAKTKGADFEIMALLKRIKSGQVDWVGPMPCRFVPPRKRSPR